METKTSKVIAANLLKKDGKPVQNKRNNYMHRITMENKDSGWYESIKDIQTAFVVGQEAEYEIGQMPKENNPNELYTKIKPVYKKAQVQEETKAEPPLETAQQASKAFDELIAEEQAHKPIPVLSLSDIAIASQKRAVEAWIGNGIGREDIQSFSREMAQYLTDLIEELSRGNV